jgi:sensor histidine kinase YesM
MFLYFHSFFTVSKFSLRKKLLGTSLIILGIVTYIFPISSYIITIIGISIGILFSLLYSSAFPKNIIFGILFSLIGTFSELLVSCLLSLLTWQPMNVMLDNQLTYCICVLLSRFLLVLVIYLIYVKRSKLNLAKNTTHFWPVVCIFAFGCIYIFYFLFTLSLQERLTNYAQVIIVITILIAFILTIFYLYNQQCKDALLRKEHDRLLHYMELQKVQQAETEAAAKRISTLKHDMKNIFIGLLSLLENERPEEALTIVKEKAALLSAPSTIVSTADSVLNTLLNYKIAYAGNYGITVHYELQLSTAIPISFDDLSILLGNAFDNAIEYLASHHTPDKWIQVYISYGYRILNIEIINPVSENIEIPVNYILPTSKQSENHGYGLSSMQKIVGEYHGTFSVSCENLEFTLKMTLTCKGESNND